MNSQPEQVVQQQSVDAFLQLLIGAVDQTNLEFAITLHVDGFLVSGMLVGVQKYFDGFGADFASGISDEKEAAKVREKISRLGMRGRAETEEHSDAAVSACIHLKDARFFTTDGNPIPSNRGVWWRGRLSAVSGFILGGLRRE